jgi:catechol 2,3-dioxygenase-like lactoylglutathione lyase family enzyme
MRLERVHHIGLRVTDEARAVAFYERFGFRTVYRDPRDPVLILLNDTGIELNLIVNAATAFDGKNPLMDVPVKLPGYTHVALEVASIEEAKTTVEAWGITITEGPVQLGPGISLFIRDPDANVIELRQNLPR